MKHLIKYNESVDTNIDVEYLNHCFSEFIDNGSIAKHKKGFMLKGSGGVFDFYTPGGTRDPIKLSHHLFEIGIEINRMPGVKGDRSTATRMTTDFDFDEAISISKTYTNTLEDIKVAVDRVKDKYPEYHILTFDCTKFTSSHTRFIFLYIQTIDPNEIANP